MARKREVVRVSVQARGRKAPAPRKARAPARQRRPSAAAGPRSVLRSGPEARFVRALFDPFTSAPARYPDMLAVGTSVTSSTLRMTLTAVPDGDTPDTFYLFTTVFPQVGSTAVATSSTNAAKVLWSSATSNGAPSVFLRYQDPLRGTGGSSTGPAFVNWASYRTTAMGLRVRNVTPVLDRGGTGVMRLSQNGVSANVEDMTYAQLSSQRNAMVFDAASIGERGVAVTWRPTNYSDLSFVGTEDTNFLPALQFYWSGDRAQTFEVEVRTHYEFIPRPNVEYLFEQGSSLGSPARVEMDVAAVLQRSGDSASAATFDTAKSVVDSMFSAADGAAESAFHLAREAYQSGRSLAQGVLRPLRSGR